jgi:hypothetical protein
MFSLSSILEDRRRSSVTELIAITPDCGRITLAISSNISNLGRGK